MTKAMQEVVGELSDNWPAFVYIIMSAAFSIGFLRERRAETRLLRILGAELQESTRIRFERLEQIILEKIQTDQGDSKSACPSRR